MIACFCFSKETAGSPKYSPFFGPQSHHALRWDRYARDGARRLAALSRVGFRSILAWSIRGGNVRFLWHHRRAALP